MSHIKKTGNCDGVNVEESLGVQVELANQEWKTFLQKLGQKDFTVARYAWMGDYNEALHSYHILKALV